MKIAVECRGGVVVGVYYTGVYEDPAEDVAVIYDYDDLDEEAAENAEADLAQMVKIY